MVEVWIPRDHGDYWEVENTAPIQGIVEDPTKDGVNSTLFWGAWCGPCSGMSCVSSLGGFARYGDSAQRWPMDYNMNVQTLLKWPGRNALIQTIFRGSWILYYSESSPDFAIVLLIIQSLMYLSSQLWQKDLINLGCIRTWLLWSHSLLNPSPTAQSLLKNYIEAFGIVFTFPCPCAYFSLLLAAVGDTVCCLSSSHYSFSVLRLKIPDIIFPVSLAVQMCISIIYCCNNAV